VSLRTNGHDDSTFTRFNCLINPDDVLDVLSGCSLGEPSTVRAYLCTWCARTGIWIECNMYVQWPHIRAIYVNCLSSPVRNLAESINKFVVLQTRFVCTARLFFLFSPPFHSFFSVCPFIYTIYVTRERVIKQTRWKTTPSICMIFKCERDWWRFY